MTNAVPADIKPFNDTITLVVCGGKSSRMGNDKSLLQYYEKPQRYYLYDMLLPFCEKVFISCNAKQADHIDYGYDRIVDEAALYETGPMAALLSAFAIYSEKNMLLIGCDYPLLNALELQHFSLVCNDSPASFYNEEANVFEPLLAWYPAASFNLLKKMHEAKQFSLQQFLLNNKATKYYPANKNAMISIDTPEAFKKVVDMLSR